jgi:hypothetical protein
MMSKKLSFALVAATLQSGICATHTAAADKFPTYGALSFFGSRQDTGGCFNPNSLASVRLAIPDTYFIAPTLLAINRIGNEDRFLFNLTSVDEFSVARPLLPVALEAWQTYVSLAAGSYDFTSLQQLSDGTTRLSDAIKVTLPPPNCTRLLGVEIIEGDLQTRVVGTGFSPLRARVDGEDQQVAKNASVALVSQPIVFEPLDTGIDGPKRAEFTAADGTSAFAITPGTRTGVKRFIVKARHAGDSNAVSTMATVLHVAAGAPIGDSAPVVEYTYEGGNGTRPKFLASSATLTNLFDAREFGTIRRTGQVWRAFSSQNAAPGLSPVCQFFGSTASGSVTHFFTADANECASLRARAESSPGGTPRLNYEGIVFYAVAPQAGRCPASFPIPIVRYFVPSPAPHHLYLVAKVTNGEPLMVPPSNTIKDGIAFCTDVAVEQ